jgi:hypothetical protein
MMVSSPLPKNPCRRARVAVGLINTMTNPVPREQSSPWRSAVAALMLLVILALAIRSDPVRADDPGAISQWTSQWTSGWDFRQSYLYSSLYTKHYDPDPDHVNNQNMLGLEGQTKDSRVMGLSIFDNSFGQKSEYLYVGKKWYRFSSEKWYTKLTGGLIHGYKDEYQDKIPLNDLGVAPALVPTLGYQNKSIVVEFNQLGLAAAMITAGFIF